jgi:hypothetical protein
MFLSAFAQESKITLGCNYFSCQVTFVGYLFSGDDSGKDECTTSRILTVLLKNQCIRALDWDPQRPASTERRGKRVEPSKHQPGRHDSLPPDQFRFLAPVFDTGEIVRSDIGHIGTNSNIKSMTYVLLRPFGHNSVQTGIRLLVL